LSVKYHTDAFEISSASAYWSRHEPLIQDASESWSTGLALPSYGPGNGGIGAAFADEDNQSHQTTEELRISSVGDTRLKWLAGYFYSDFESSWDIIFPSQTGAEVYGSNSLFTYYSPFKILQQSIFGEVTYNITEPFAVTVGARRYHYDAPVELNQSGALTSTVMTSTSENAQGVTPKVSLSYQFDQDLLAYLTAAKGFRPGGGTGPVPTSGPLSCEAQLMIQYGSKEFVNGPISFSSDSVWSYELGEKWRSSDGRFSINASGYFESWVGVQQVNALSSCGYVYTANVGDAHVYGSEIEARAIVVRDLEASTSVTYSHAALVSSTLIDAGFNPGTAIQQVPRWSGSVSLAYHHALTDELAVTARAESNYVGSRTDETFATNTLPSYDLTNIRGGFQGERWSAVLFMNNVADKRALLNNVTQDAVNLPTFNRVAVSQPRTVGVDLNYKFK
jgi:outer membrane receptor protein involved in Fe transport